MASSTVSEPVDRLKGLGSILVGCLFGVVLPIGGQLTGAEVVIVAWGIFNMFRSRRRETVHPLLTWIPVLMLIASACLVLADGIGQADVGQSYKTWTRFALIPILVLLITGLVATRQLNLRRLNIGMGFGVIFAVLVKAGYVVSLAGYTTLADLWKYKMGAWLIVAMVAFIPERRRWEQVAALLFLGVFSANSIAGPPQWSASP